MSQTLQNQITYAKSMNGIVTLQDGAGTVISNGVITSNTIDSSLVDTSQLIANNFSVSNLTFNNTSTTITINNYDFSNPVRPSGGIYTLYTGSTTQSVGTVLPGWGFSGTSYSAIILKDTGNGTYYTTYFPTASNQCLVLQTTLTNSCSAFSQNYNLTKGQFEFIFSLQSGSVPLWTIKLEVI